MDTQFYNSGSQMRKLGKLERDLVEFHYKEHFISREVANLKNQTIYITLCSTQYLEDLREEMIGIS
jgi:hypothetical protein